MDATLIIVIILGVAFVVGGPIIGSLASKASEKSTESSKKDKN